MFLSDRDQNRHDVGITSDVEYRLEWHNSGSGGHTADHRPWSVVVAVEFLTEEQAVRFEQYLMSGSGRALATRHLGDIGPPPTDEAP